MVGGRVYIVYTENGGENTKEKFTIQGVYTDRHDALKQVEAINRANLNTDMTAFWSAQEIK